jgi:hypothetical protein
MRVPYYGSKNVAPTQKAKPLLSAETSFPNTKLPWNKHKLGHWSRRGPKLRTTVLARPNSNLLDHGKEKDGTKSERYQSHQTVGTKNDYAGEGQQQFTGLEPQWRYMNSMKFSG